MNEFVRAVRSDPIALNGKPLRFVDIARIGARQGSLIADAAALTRVASARRSALCWRAPAKLHLTGNACRPATPWRQHAAYYTLDRPLSAELEAVGIALGSDAFMNELIGHSGIMELDEFFALGPIN